MLILMVCIPQAFLSGHSSQVWSTALHVPCSNYNIKLSYLPTQFWDQHSGVLFWLYARTRGHHVAIHEPLFAWKNSDLNHKTSVAAANTIAIPTHINLSITHNFLSSFRIASLPNNTHNLFVFYHLWKRSSSPSSKLINNVLIYATRWVIVSSSVARQQTTGSYQPWNRLADYFICVWTKTCSNVA